MITPKGEIPWVGYYDANGECHFVITSKPIRDYYYLYGIDGGMAKKLGKAKSPEKLVADYNVMEIVKSIKPKRKAVDNTE